MNQQARAAYVISQAACLNAAIAGMVAENKKREALGQSMAYVEEDFNATIDEFGMSHNAVLLYLGD